MHTQERKRRFSELVRYGLYNFYDIVLCLDILVLTLTCEESTRGWCFSPAKHTHTHLKSYWPKKAHPLFRATNTRTWGCMCLHNGLLGPHHSRPGHAGSKGYSCCCTHTSDIVCVQVPSQESLSQRWQVGPGVAFHRRGKLDRGYTRSQPLWFPSTVSSSVSGWITAIGVNIKLTFSNQ